MKKNINPLYKLLQDNAMLMREKFILRSKDDLSRRYCVYTPRACDEINQIDGFKVVEYHITVFEKLRKEVQYSTFHLTINLIDDNKNPFVARIYYHELGHILFYTAKNVNENTRISIDSQDELLQFGSNNIKLFIERILSLKKAYVNYYNALKTQIDQQEGILNQPISRDTPKKLSNYQKKLQLIIQHIESIKLFKKDYLKEIEVYKNLLWDTEIKLGEIQKTVSVPTVAIKSLKAFVVPPLEPIQEEKQSVIPESIPGKNNSAQMNIKKQDYSKDIINIDNKIKTVTSSKQLNNTEKTLQKYDLQIQKLDLLNKMTSLKSKDRKKFKVNENVLLDTSTQVNHLLNEINDQILNIISEKDKKIKPESFEGLLQHSTRDTTDILEMIVKSNRPDLLNLLMAIRKNTNLDAKTRNEKKCPLQIAFDNESFEIFQSLLNHKASPDILYYTKNRFLNEQFILCVAAYHGRGKEMEALLEANANPLAINKHNGFSPIGCLLMRAKTELNNIPLAKVFLTYAPEAIDQQQGMDNKETPFTYACHKDLKDVIDLLLSFGADPNLSRLSDDVTPLGLCVNKNNFELFEHIIKNSIRPVTEGLTNALDIAILMGDRWQFVNYIMNYSSAHQLNLTLPSPEEVKQRNKKIISSRVNVNHNFSFFFHEFFTEEKEDDHHTLVNDAPSPSS